MRWLIDELLLGGVKEEVKALKEEVAANNRRTSESLSMLGNHVKLLSSRLDELEDWAVKLVAWLNDETLTAAKQVKPPEPPVKK